MMNLRPAVCFLIGSIATGWAGETVEKQFTTPVKSLNVSYEVEGSYGYVGSARNELGNGRTGGISEQDTSARFVVAPRWGEGPIFRLGVHYQRYSFGLPERAPLPNTLQSISAVVGMDFSLFDSWLLRIEAEPGVYSDFDDINRGDFNVPFILGGAYIAGADLQWIVGIGVDLNREYPVLPAVGVHWKFADRWTLNAVVPSPRLEFQYNKELMFFVGGDLKQGTYRVGQNSHSNKDLVRLNNAVLEYNEIRVGAGLSWKACSKFTCELEAGYMPYREFNFHRADRNFEGDGGAPYGQFSFNTSF